MNNLTIKSDAELRDLLQQSHQVLTTLARMFDDRPDVQHAVRCLMSPDHVLVEFSRLAGSDPVLKQRVLQACVAALVNVQSVEAVEAELKRRAVTGN